TRTTHVPYNYVRVPAPRPDTAGRGVPGSLCFACRRATAPGLRPTNRSPLPTLPSALPSRASREGKGLALRYRLAAAGANLLAGFLPAQLGGAIIRLHDDPGRR